MNRNRDRFRAGTRKGASGKFASPQIPVPVSIEGGNQIGMAVGDELSERRTAGSIATRHVRVERVPARAQWVRRRQLFERLSATPPGGVALVCAPAGSGKTILLRSWVEAEGLGERVAWVAVERGEQDAQRFWLSVIDALADTIDGELIERIKPTPNFRGRGGGRTAALRPRLARGAARAGDRRSARAAARPRR